MGLQDDRHYQVLQLLLSKIFHVNHPYPYMTLLSVVYTHSASLRCRSTTLLPIEGSSDTPACPSLHCNTFVKSTQSWTRPWYCHICAEGVLVLAHWELKIGWETRRGCRTEAKPQHEISVHMSHPLRRRALHGMGCECRPQHGQQQVGSSTYIFS